MRGSWRLGEGGCQENGAAGVPDPSTEQALGASITFLPLTKQPFFNTLEGLRDG
jgi:hypothetical protein